LHVRAGKAALGGQSAPGLPLSEDEVVVRCVGCEAAVSEWARRCPSCGHDVSDAPALSDEPASAEAAAPPAPGHEPAASANASEAPVTRPALRQAASDASPRSPGPSHQRRSRLVIAVGAAVAIVAAGVAGLAVSHRWPSGRGSAHLARSSLLASVPDALRGYAVIYVDHDVSVLPLNGQPERVVPGLSTSAYPDVPVRAGRSVVVASEGTAYRLTKPFHRRAQALGPADHLVPVMAPGDVGLVRGSPPGPLTVQEISVTSAAGAGPLAQPARLPAGYDAVAQVDTGVLVVQTPRSGVSGRRLAVWQPYGGGHFTRTLGHATSVIGVHGSTVAWRAERSCGSSSGSYLHLTDTTTGTDRVTGTPEGHCRYEDGGAFSPDGRLLAVFVDAPPSIGPNAQLAVIDLSADVPTQVAQSVVPGPGWTAVWSPDGKVVLFGGVSCSGPPGGCVEEAHGHGGPLLAFQPGDAGAVALFIPSSSSFIVA